jgi:hypothetical protein
VPSPGFAELYFQTAYDASVAPPGKHTMSVFAQYAPYELDHGSWEARRDEIGRCSTRSRFAGHARGGLHGGARTARHRGASVHRVASSRASASPTRCGKTAHAPHPIDGVHLAARTHPAGSDRPERSTPPWPSSPIPPDPALRDGGGASTVKLHTRGWWKEPSVRAGGRRGSRGCSHRAFGRWAEQGSVPRPGDVLVRSAGRRGSRSRWAPDRT